LLASTFHLDSSQETTSLLSTPTFSPYDTFNDAKEHHVRLYLFAFSRSIQNIIKEGRGMAYDGTVAFTNGMTIGIYRRLYFPRRCLCAGKWEHGRPQGTWETVSSHNAPFSGIGSIVDLEEA